MSGQAWLLYALGGGLGHFQRSLALARAAARRGIPATMVTNTLSAPVEGPWIPESVSIQRLPATASREEIAARLAPLLSRDWAACVVDTFPRGLGGELADWLPRLRALKVWTHRDLCPAYLQQFRIRREWAPKYDLCLSPGDDGELADLCHSTPPWLIAKPDELMAPNDARAAWDAEPDRPLVVVVGAGLPEEQAELQQLAEQLTRARSDLQVRTATLKSAAIWPLFPRLTAADVVIGSGGYNLVRETQALGVPLLALARPRMYDRQRRRIAHAPHAQFLAAGASLAIIHAMIDGAGELRREARLQAHAPDTWNALFPAGFGNGADLAVDAILRATCERLGP